MGSLEDLLGIDDKKIEALTSNTVESEPNQAEQLQALDRQFRSEGIALVLGAGLSAAAGLPDWRTLMSSLSVQSLATRLGVKDAHASALAHIYDYALPESPLLRVRYLRQAFDDQTSRPERFLEAIRRGLYAEVKAVREVPLLMSVAQLCKRGQASPGGVIEAITYNYDQLFEAALEEVACSHVARGPGDGSTKEHLAVRHVHGSLAQGDRPLAPEWLVLAEEDYHTHYSDPYSWSNIVQLNAFSERRCLFVGVSLDDPYTRRLLEAIQRKSGGAGTKHYAFMCCMSASDLRKKLPVAWFESGQPAQSEARLAARLRLITELVDSHKEKALRALGVEVIWYKEHDQLPGLIEQVGRLG